MPRDGVVSSVELTAKKVIPAPRNMNQRFAGITSIQVFSHLLSLSTCLRKRPERRFRLLLEERACGIYLRFPVGTEHIRFSRGINRYPR
jgi:hypothetical protein